MLDNRGFDLWADGYDAAFGIGKQLIRGGTVRISQQVKELRIVKG